MTKIKDLLMRCPQKEPKDGSIAVNNALPTNDSNYSNAFIHPNKSTNKNKIAITMHKCLKNSLFIKIN